MSTQNQHHVRKNCLGKFVRMRRQTDCLSLECRETEGHENKEKENMTIDLKVCHFVGLLCIS